MKLLLVLRNTRLRRELVQACASLSRELQCFEADDALNALFEAPLDQLELVVLDAASEGPVSSAQLSHWRRMAPRSRLLLLDPHQADAALHLRQAVVEAMTPLAPGSASALPRADRAP